MSSEAGDMFSSKIWKTVSYVFGLEVLELRVGVWKRGHGSETGFLNHRTTGACWSYLVWCCDCEHWCSEASTELMRH